MPVQKWSNKTVYIGRQPDLTTANTTRNDMIAVACEVSLPKRGLNKQDVDHATGQPGTGFSPVIGPRQGSEITLKMPVTVYKYGYNPATDVPGVGAVLPPAALLIGSLLGSRSDNVSSAADWKSGAGLWHVAYDDEAVAPTSTTSVVKLKTGKGASVKVGALLACLGPGTVGPAVTCAGFVKSVSGDNVTLLAPSAAAAAEDNAIGPSSTAALTSAEQVPLTIMIAGEEDSFCDVAIGCVAKSAKFAAQVGDPLMLEIVYAIKGDLQRNQSGGGVAVPNDGWPVMPPMIGAFGGRAVIDGSPVDVQEFEVAIECELHDHRSHGSLQGISAVTTVRRKVTAQLTVARLDDDMDDELDVTDRYQLTPQFGTNNQPTMQFGVGGQAGQGFVLALPAQYVAEEPELKEIDGVIYYAIKTAPRSQLTDTPADFEPDEPRNTALRAAWY